MSFRFFKSRSWDIRNVEQPWTHNRSIYGHILAHLRPEPGLTEGGDELPDEGRIGDGTGWHWAPGALDGAFGHHGGAGGSAAEVAQEILDALAALTRKATTERARELYSLLSDHSTLEFIDPLLEGIVQDERINPERLHSIARWIATESPDREPVKTAIAILGLVRGGGDRDLLITLGRHDEFTLYVAVALRNTEDELERWLFELAKYVTGWGRVQIIERLAGTEDERIKAWLLREGYKNDILIEYTALICAKSGDLLGDLRLPQPDGDLLKGTGEILKALVQGRGGPVEGLETYPEGAEVADLYLAHLSASEPDLEDFLVVTSIERFLDEPEGEAHDAALGWPQRRAVLLDHIKAIRSRPGWEERVHKGLASEDPQLFWHAAEAAKVLGVDTWDVYFQRLQHGEDHWYFVMQTDNVERIDRVVQLAEERLPLKDIASGPENQLGLGPEFQPHSALDFVLQDLRRFPGRGWPLIRAGLQSPVIRNRNGALRVIASWQREEWPPEATSLLGGALEDEPNAETRELIRKVIAGEALD